MIEQLDNPNLTMNKIKIIALAGAALALTFAVQSCQKLEETKDNITSAEDFANVESEFAAAFEVSDDVNTNDGRVKKAGSTILPSGAVLTFTDTSFTDGDGVEYSLDFGVLGTTTPKGMLCNDGRYRAGKLTVTVSKPYLQIGTVVTLTINESDNYYSGDGVNMTQLSGVLTITRTEEQKVELKLDNGKATNSRGTRNFKGTKVIERTVGSSTPGTLGDEFKITGSGEGTNKEGDNYTWSITTPLVKKIELGCARTFVVGVIEVKNTNSSSAISVNFDPYNNGACDRIAEATINGKKFTFTVQ